MPVWYRPVTMSPSAPPPLFTHLNSNLDKVTFYRGTKYLQADFKLGEQGYKLQIFSDGTGIKLFDSSWDPIWQTVLKSSLTSKAIEVPFAEGIVSDIGYDKMVLSVSGSVAKIHFRAKRTTGNYTIATIPEGYQPIFQANCALTVPVNAGSVSTVYSAVVESSGILRFSGAVPSEQIFEGDLVYIIK